MQTNRTFCAVGLLCFLTSCASMNEGSYLTDSKSQSLARLDSTEKANLLSSSAPSGLPPGSQIIGVKTFTVPRYDGVKNDGETAFTLTNLHLTVYRLRLGDGSNRTAAVVDFHLTNHTQNDKGTHNHYVKLNLLGAGQNVLDPNQMTVELQRDTCTPSNPVISGLHMFQTDIFDQVQIMSYGWSGKWTYEGKC